MARYSKSRLAFHSVLNRIARYAIGLLVFLTGMAVQASVPFHDISVELDPVRGDISIDNRIELEGLSEFALSMAPWLEIEAILLDGKPVELSAKDGPAVLALPGTGRHQLDIKVQGRVPHRNAADADSVASSGADGLYLPAWAGWVPGDYRLPMRYRLRVEVPAGQRAVATGRLVDEKRSDVLEIAEFVQDFPGEAPSLFAGPYRVQERLEGGLRLRTYFHAGLEPLAESYLVTAGAYIRRFAAQIGEYPYDDFHIVSAPLPVGLGFSNLTYIGREIVPLPFMRGRSLAHEVLHNWWGNGVGVDYAGGNWAEGLTTYLADYGLERDKGAGAAREMRRKWLRDYAALPAERDRPVRAFRAKRHQASQVIGYNKAAFLFHMLELEIGAEAFAGGLREFWQRHKFAIAGWDDIRAAFEDSSGRGLDWFFSQWLDRAGAPRLSVGAYRVEQDGSDYRISVEVLQPVGGYRFLLPVILQTENGSERHQIVIEDSLTRLEWVVDARPISIRFDPDNDVFRLLHADEAPPILRDVTLDPQAATVVESVDEAFVEAADQLSTRLFEDGPQILPLSEARATARSLLIITESGGLPGLLKELGLENPPLPPGPVPTAAAWTARLTDGRAVIVVSADDAEQLRALLRPLPHYGSRSYVLFDSGKAIARGVWPVERGPLYREFDVKP